MKRRKVLIILSVVVLIFLAWVTFRNNLLNQLLYRQCGYLEKRYDMQISYHKAAFTGFKSFYISNLCVVLNDRDTFINSDSIVVSPKLIPVISGHIRLDELQLYKTKISLTGRNLYQIKTKINGNNKSKSYDNSQTANFAGLINAFQNNIIKHIPKIITIRNTLFTYTNDTNSSSFFCENFSYHHSNYVGDVFLSDKSDKDRCLINGILDVKKYYFTLSVSRPDSSLIFIPYTNAWLKFVFGFGSFRLTINMMKGDNEHQIFSGQVKIRDMAVKNAKLSDDTVFTKSANLNLNVKTGKGFIEIDSTSSITVNKFSFSPYFLYEHSERHSFTFKFLRKEFDAPILFCSFPEGLFTNFKGLVTKGRLAYSLRTYIDLDNPDSLIFDSRLENKGFEIEKFGVTDFRILNQKYHQDLYDKDKYVKTIIVGSDNPDFVSLEDISPYLKYSVLTSEDGDFFFHHGFNQKAFRESVVANIKAKRFVRGGSTITMQLVKNAFLRSNKYISRKLEEALIVWMIENLHLVSKERMFEVYLNIIEWGPGVYGIKPASVFYFNKLPSKLSLSESIFLTSIIPRPKGFRYSFVSNGEMAGFYGDYSKLLCKFMLKHNQITAEDSAKLQPFVKLTGEAKKFLAVPDTIEPEDSVFYREPEIIIN